MPTRLVHVVVDAADPAGLARFWAAALGWETTDESAGEVDVWPAGYSYPDPAALPLVFVPVTEPKSGKNRVHLDLATTSAAHQAEWVSRLLELGADLKAAQAERAALEERWLELEMLREEAEG